MNGMSNKSAPLGFQQLTVLKVFLDAEEGKRLTTYDFQNSSWLRIPKKTSSSPATTQSYISERLAGLVRRGILSRNARTINNHMIYEYTLGVPRSTAEKIYAEGVTKVPKQKPAKVKTAEVKEVEAPVRRQTTITLSSGITLTAADVEELLAFLVVRG